MSYTWKDLAQILGVSERTVRRSVKKLGIEGTLSDRESGGTVRVFSEVELNRLKEMSDRPLLPVKREEAPETGLSIGLSTALETLGQVGTALAELPELRAQVGEAMARLETLRQQGEQTERTLRALVNNQEALLKELRTVREEREGPGGNGCSGRGGREYEQRSGSSRKSLGTSRFSLGGELF